MITYTLFFIAMFLLSKLILTLLSQRNLKKNLLKSAQIFKETKDYSCIKEKLYQNPLPMLWCLKQYCTDEELKNLDLKQLHLKEFKPDRDYINFSLGFISNLSFEHMQEPETLGNLLNSFLDTKKAP